MAPGAVARPLAEQPPALKAPGVEHSEKYIAKREQRMINNDLKVTINPVFINPLKGRPVHAESKQTYVSPKTQKRVHYLSATAIAHVGELGEGTVHYYWHLRNANFKDFEVGVHGGKSYFPEPTRLTSTGGEYVAPFSNGFYGVDVAIISADIRRSQK
jgi:hypothetical protein